MAIKYQFNKTSLNELGKQLKVRTKALPTIKSKESALRLEVKKARDMSEHYSAQIEELLANYDYMAQLWGEFDGELLKVKDVELSITKIAGVRIPVLQNIIFEEKSYDMFSSPAWIHDGVELLKQIARLGIEGEFYRKKTTQKVNLYEKVQIPGYEDAIRKIKRYLEDEENLSKSSQKIVKNKQQAEEDAV